MMKEKLSEDENETIQKTIKETDQWFIEEHTKEDYEGKYEQLNKELNPILMKVQEGPSEGMPFTSEPVPSDVPKSQGPSIDEVD